MKTVHIDKIADDEFYQIDMARCFNTHENEFFMGVFELVDESEGGAAAKVSQGVVRYALGGETLKLLFLASEGSKCDLLPWIGAAGKRRQVTDAELGKLLAEVDGWLVSGIVPAGKDSEIATLWFGVVRKARWIAAGRPAFLATSVGG